MKPYKLLLISLFIVVALPVGAQGTAFTYQGRLIDRGSPANGVYDLQFTVSDSLTNGNAVGGPLTNSATGVSNGLFTVTLDFGSGVFTGPNRWLEIAARTNGATTFTTLMPRQALSAAPFAVYSANAGSAAGVSGSVSASQLSGTLALARLPGEVLTNNEQGVNLTGSLTGNLIGNATTATTARAVSGSGVNDTNLDNQLWMYEQADRLEDNLNVARYSWTNTITKLRSPNTIKIQIDGTGLSGYIGNAFLTNLSTQIPFAGMNDGWFSIFIPLQDCGSALSGAAFQSSGKDGWWFGAYCYTTNDTGVIGPFNCFPRYNWNILEVDYIVYANGSSFKVQTNSGASSFADISGTISTLGAGTKGASWFWTNVNGPQGLNFKIVSLSAGTNRIVSAGAWNSNITNGFIAGDLQNSGSSMNNMLAIPTNITGPIYANWKPDILILQSIEVGGAVANIATNFAALVKFYRTWIPNCDLVNVGTYPTMDQATMTSYQSEYNYYQASIKNGLAHFDAWTPFESTNNIYARGLGLPANDPHYSGCYPIWGYFFYRWLDFQDFYLEGGLPTANAITGGITTNILIGRHTFYYTNGVLTNIQ